MFGVRTRSYVFFFFSSRRRHTRCSRDWSSDVCSSDLTTLRDGEQAPGNSVTAEEKLRLARQLDTLGVDVIEAGFPSASEGDRRAVRAIAEDVRRPVLAALARCPDRDIAPAGEGGGPRGRPRGAGLLCTPALRRA